jgi:hypothetical protein
VKFWEVMANLRWAVIALQQSDRFLIGGARNLSTAITGRRATECELELLMLLDSNGPPPQPSAARGGGSAPVSAMRDLPKSRDLLALARELLLDELLPLLPPERQRDAHLIATSMAIAAREAAGEGWQEELDRRLAGLYGESTALVGFAADLRNGAFETSPSRAAAARAILWRLTMAKLREGNPHFLAANGFNPAGDEGA